MPGLPQIQLVDRLTALPAATAIVNKNIFPELVPTLPQYPAIVFKVLENSPYNDADGGSNSYLMKIQVSCLAIAKGPTGPYTIVWNLANAVAGDAEHADENGDRQPTGLSGWHDANGSIWHLVDEFDESGEIRDGTETYWAYVVNQLYTVQYVRF